MSKELTTIPDLSYRFDPDGPWIDLEQDAGYGEVSRITMHACHLRLLFEEAGHLLPHPPADELACRLAWQLCSVLLELCNEAGTSPAIDRVIDTLIAYRDSLPNHVFPHGLYPDDAPEVTRRMPDKDRPGFELSIQGAKP